ncbi:unnamed protein product [Rotaria sp. Silwood2]|nr:unnamed protein product [Rotaria sp. Silwood2]CAF3310081.1 unnamed protein product [Rotaria sp. Silwood2]CAF4511872.1 unnamed protein product [Rotaria sp. Silwood2]CAF4686395.1 unnamed protein product [Rotaria sp. Silwood2]
MGAGAIVEPASRLGYIQEYRLSVYSLYAAVSVGSQTNDIIETLQKLSSTAISNMIIEFINLCTLNYGKVKLVLKHNQYFVESACHNILKNLLHDSQIQECRLITRKINIDINSNVSVQQ